MVDSWQALGMCLQSCASVCASEKGKPVVRWGRKATGLYEKKRGCRATEWWGGQLPKGLAPK
jgi:hypothetical protein